MYIRYGATIKVADAADQATKRRLKEIGYGYISLSSYRERRRELVDAGHDIEEVWMRYEPNRGSFETRPLSEVRRENRVRNKAIREAKARDAKRAAEIAALPFDERVKAYDAATQGERWELGKLMPRDEYRATVDGWHALRAD